MVFQEGVHALGRRCKRALHLLHEIFSPGGAFDFLPRSWNKVISSNRLSCNRNRWLFFIKTISIIDKFIAINLSINIASADGLLAWL